MPWPMYCIHGDKTAFRAFATSMDDSLRPFRAGSVTRHAGGFGFGGFLV
jgi:hypothetical protein